MAEDRKCTHAGCICLADPGSDYCSAQCQMANGAEHKQCGCPHDICREQQELPPSGIPDGSHDPAMSTADKQKPLMDDWGKSDKH
jgi:hypothetical protein